eukprot:XP_020407623.1 uncharacterized protein LOC109945706 [Zea mays]
MAAWPSRRSARPRRPRPAPSRPPSRPVLGAACPRGLARGSGTPPRPGLVPHPDELPCPDLGALASAASTARPPHPAQASPRFDRGVPAQRGAAPCARPRPRPSLGVSPRPCAAYGGDDHFRLAKRMEASAGAVPSDVQIYLRGHRGPNPANPSCAAKRQQIVW